MIDHYLTKEGQDEVYSGERPGCHSSAHWFKVAQLGVLIALSEGADTVVPLLFAFYHDCRRENDGDDPEHGWRGGELAREHFEKGWLSITEDQLEILHYACEYHTDGKVSEVATISACWDADRLDLPRVGIQTDPQYLTSRAAKTLAVHQAYFYEGKCTCGQRD